MRLRDEGGGRGSWHRKRIEEKKFEKKAFGPMSWGEGGPRFVLPRAIARGTRQIFKRKGFERLVVFDESLSSLSLSLSLSFSSPREAATEICRCERDEEAWQNVPRLFELVRDTLFLLLHPRTRNGGGRVSTVCCLSNLLLMRFTNEKSISVDVWEMTNRSEQHVEAVRIGSEWILALDDDDYCSVAAIFYTRHFYRMF